MGQGEVLVLDDDEDLRDAIGDLVGLISGRSCLKLGRSAEMWSNRARVLDCTLAILDVNLGLGAPSGLDAYDWLRAQGFAGQIVFLTGHSDGHPLVRRASALGRALVLQKPIGLEEIRVLLANSDRTLRETPARL